MADIRPQRADAVRNRTKILDAAREQITMHGPDVPMDVIAEAAEVAVGTLYRHYPTKTALVTAVLTEHVEHLTSDIEKALKRVAEEGTRPMDELTELVANTVEAAARNHAVKAATQRFGAAEYMREQEERALATLTRIITAAQADGDLHPDVTADDFALLLATAPIDQPPEVRARWLTLFLPGFTAAARPQL